MVLPAGKKNPKQSQVLLLAFLALQNSKALISFSIFKSTVTLILCETARSTQSKNILKSSMLKKKKFQRKLLMISTLNFQNLQHL